jgi:hypothetical protein
VPYSLEGVPATPGDCREEQSTEKAETLAKNYSLDFRPDLECARVVQKYKNVSAYTKPLTDTDLSGKAQNGSIHAVSPIARKNV